MDKLEFDKKIITLRDPLFRMAYSILLSRDEAQDAVQDLLLLLWEKREDLSSVDNMSAFAFRSMRNKALDLLRKRHPENDDFAEQISESATPYEHTESLDTMRRIQEHINRLPEMQRSIMRMRDVEGMEIDEIAYICDISPNATRVNLSRARQKIRELITKDNIL